MSGAQLALTAKSHQPEKTNEMDGEGMYEAASLRRLKPKLGCIKPHNCPRTGL